MKSCCEEKQILIEKPLLENSNTRNKGGIKSLPYIWGNDALEKMATFGLTANMILYLTEQYHMEMATASNILFFWTAATYLTPLIGAVIADSYLGRFYTIALGSIIYLLGVMLLWSTTVIPQARPYPCDQSSNVCIPPTFLQSSTLCVSFGLISIGAGGIRSSSIAFGANQLQKEESPENGGVSESYFNWYFVTYTFSVFIGLTFLVYIQENMGWTAGFALPFGLVLFGALLFFLGSPLYVEVQCKSSLVTGLIQVVVASYRNRNFAFPSDNANVMYHYKNGLADVPSGKLRFLNKACILRDLEKDLMPDGRAKDPWRLCTIDQVEELKALLNVVPIWSTGMIMFAFLSQNSFSVLQAASMDRHITSTFSIPAASFSFIAVISAILWAVLYDRVFIPLSSRLMRRPIQVSTTRRMGIGIFLTFFTLIVTAFVESMRINSGPHQMSTLWLVPQYCLNGLAQASNDIAQIQFYFSELPKSMSGIASTLDGLGVSGGNLLASFLMSSVDNISKIGGHQSWISSDINKGHYDYYYLVLAGLGVANIVYYVVCIKAYGPLKAGKPVPAEKDEL